MIVTAVIEIPRGDDRRRHINKYNKTKFIDLGPMKGHIPVNDGIAPEHYGFIPGTHNPHDGDEVDVLVFSDRELTVGQTIGVEPIALLKRVDGDEKIIAVEADSAIKCWEDLDQSRRELVLRFYSSRHPITQVDDKAQAENYILASQSA